MTNLEFPPPAWKDLTRFAAATVNRSAADISERATFNRSLSVGGLTLDLHKQRIDDQAYAGLQALAEQRDLPSKIQAMFRGDEVNPSEGRAALHTALRHRTDTTPTAIAAEVVASLTKLEKFTEQVRSGAWRGFSGKPITDLVHIGIGGSHLGPEMVVKALADPTSRGPKAHFVANVDPGNLHRALQNLDPATTLFVVVSKSFTTLETQQNANAARSWFIERTGSLDAIAKHFVAVSSNTEAALKFGMPAENLFPMWDWVGGRYSLWSAVGAPIAIALGWQPFSDLLAGAAAMDAHFSNEPLTSNIPVQMALSGVWNTNFLGATNHVMLPYDERLALLPDWLQQLDMESNGKSVRLDGTPVVSHTAPILWGGRGTNGQHAFHQLLHQGTRAYAADFVLVGTPAPGADQNTSDQHRWLLANALAQSQAMANGKLTDDPNRLVRGNHASSTFILDALTPTNLGALLAAYEHKVFCQGVIWDINSFDQWGVELGKELAKPIFGQLGGAPAITQDESTRTLIEALRN